jgi:hypothetical protein
MAYRQSTNVPQQDTLPMGQHLNSGEYIRSLNGMFFCAMQPDGNFVVYKSVNFLPMNAVWASNTWGRPYGPFRCSMQTDGNLVIYNSRGQSQWASNSVSPQGSPHRLVMQNDRDLVIYDSSNRAVWSARSVDPSLPRTVAPPLPQPQFVQGFVVPQQYVAQPQAYAVHPPVYGAPMQQFAQAPQVVGEPFAANVPPPYPAPQPQLTFQQPSTVQYTSTNTHCVLPGKPLIEGQYLQSKNGVFFAVLKETGDFNVYITRDFRQSNLLWTTGNSYHQGQRPYRLEFNSSGLKVIGAGATVLYSFEYTKNGIKSIPYSGRLEIADDGSLLLFDDMEDCVWSSGSQINVVSVV